MKKIEYRSKNGAIEFCGGRHCFRLTYSAASYFSNHPVLTISLFGWGVLFIRLPWHSNKKYEDDANVDAPEYGVYFYRELGEEQGFFHEIVLCLGKKCKHIRMPWAFGKKDGACHIWNVRATDGSWIPYIYPYHDYNSDQYKEWKSKIWWAKIPYTYVRNNGEVQKAIATVYEEWMEWRRYWLPFTSKFARIKHSIDVTFSTEIGEGVDTWKGGTIGCDYEMREGETVFDCLRRMERERRFDR